MGKSINSAIEITPKLISNNQWEIMRDELEGEIKGLALDKGHRFLLRQKIHYRTNCVPVSPKKVRYKTDHELNG